MDGRLWKVVKIKIFLVTLKRNHKLIWIMILLLDLFYCECLLFYYDFFTITIVPPNYPHLMSRSRNQFNTQQQQQQDSITGLSNEVSCCLTLLSMCNFPNDWGGALYVIHTKIFIFEYFQKFLKKWPPHTLYPVLIPNTSYAKKK